MPARCRPRLPAANVCSTCGSCCCRLLPLYDLVRGRTFTAKGAPRAVRVNFEGQYFDHVRLADPPSTHFAVGPDQLIDSECSLGLTYHGCCPAGRPVCRRPWVCRALSLAACWASLVVVGDVLGRMPLPLGWCAGAPIVSGVVVP